MAPERETFLRYAVGQGDKCCVIDPTGREWTRHEILLGASCVYSALNRHGIGDGNCVAIACPNSAEFIMCYFGCVYRGVSVVPINWHLTADEIAHMLRVAKPSAIIVHGLHLAKLGSAIEKSNHSSPIWPLQPGRAVRDIFKDISKPNPAAVLEPPSLGRTLLFTSATTGLPKAVRLPNSNGYAALQRTIAFHKALGARSDSCEKHLCTSMLYHSAPLDGVLTTLHMGNAVLLMHRWDAEGALQLMARHKVSVAFMIPIMMLQMARIPVSQRRRYDLSALRMIMHGGSPCHKEAKLELMNWLGPVIYETYGATEGAGTFATPADWTRYPGTVGRPIPGAAIEIRDPTGAPLPHGQEGHIYIRPYTQDRFEYVNDKAATEASYAGDMFTAGDIGVLNQEGFLFVKDRRVDLIISGGTNIYPAEIEEQILRHPEILDCAVIGKPHQSLGQTAHAIICLTHASSDSGQRIHRELIRILVASLSPHKIPRSIEIVDQVPRDPNGKLLRRRLREQQGALPIIDATTIPPDVH